jgi:hypothetical protein
MLLSTTTNHNQQQNEAVMVCGNFQVCGDWVPEDLLKFGGLPSMMGYSESDDLQSLSQNTPNC